MREWCRDARGEGEQRERAHVGRDARADVLVAGACRARAEGQRGRESMWAARTHLFLSPGTGAMPDTRSENESMLIEGELVAKGAGVEGDVPTWCGTPPMSAAGRFYSFFSPASLFASGLYS